MPDRSLKSRRDAQAELSPSAQFYRQIAETIPQMTWSARADGSIDFFNARVYQYTGRNHKQLEGWGWRMMVHPDDWERCFALWTKAFTKGQPYEVEYRLRRRDGKYLWHLGAAMPLREGGRIVRWFGTCTEIENQKRAERLLEKARQTLGSLVSSRAEQLKTIDSRFRGLVEGAPVMIWESGPDKLYTFFNKLWLDFTGRTAEQELGAGWTDGVYPGDLRRCLATYDGAFDARVPFEMEYRLRRHDGQYRWIVDRGVPVVDPVRGFRGYIGSCIDVTEQRDQQERFRSFLDNMPAIAWIKDSRLRYSWISASYARVHGKTIDELRGRDDFDLWPEPLAQHFRRDDEKALRVDGAVQCINNVPFADGDAARWMVVKFPMPDGTGASGVAGIGFDITVRDGGKAVLADAEAGDSIERLSARERQVLQLIVNGCTSAEVGVRLGLSPKSIDTYRSRLMAKLGIDDLPSLVKFAIRHGLTTIG